MTEYVFHWRLLNSPLPAPSVRLRAESSFHGASLALQHFMQIGSDLGAPLAHVDITEPDGARHTLLVEEVLDWLSDARQTSFVQRERLATLLELSRM